MAGHDNAPFAKSRVSDSSKGGVFGIFGTVKCATCEQKAVARGLCNKCYGSARRRGDITPLDRSMMHRVSGVDAEAKTGVCSLCGPVRVRIRTGGRGPECQTQRQQNWSQTRVKMTSEDRRNQKYKITSAFYDQLLASQNECCAICKSSSRPLVVDHDHACCPYGSSCGKCVRGLLCAKCNAGIGFLGDSAENLARASTYLGGR